MTTNDALHPKGHEQPWTPSGLPNKCLECGGLLTFKYGSNKMEQVNATGVWCEAHLPGFTHLNEFQVPTIRLLVLLIHSELSQASHLLIVCGLYMYPLGVQWSDPLGFHLLLSHPPATCGDLSKLWFLDGLLWSWHAAWIYRQRKDRGNCPYFARILGFQKMPWKVKWKGKERRK